MKPSYGSAFGIGAVAGLILALCAFVFVAATGGVTKLDVIGGGSAIEPALSVPTSAMWIVSILTGATCGLILAVVTRTIARVIDPTASSVSLAIIAPLGFVVGGVISFAILPLGITVLGSLADGVATIPVADLVLLVAIGGIVGGAVIVWQSYIMARPPLPEQDPELLAT